MKVVDEKGKLFGRLNVIDLIVLVLVIVVAVVVAVKVLGGAGEDAETEIPFLSGGEPSKLTYIVRITAQRESMAERIKEFVDTSTGKRDEQISDTEELKNAYVVDFWTEPTAYVRKSDGSFELYNTSDTDEVGLVDIIFVLTADVEDSLTNMVGAQQIKIGNGCYVKTTHMLFYGTIEGCTWEPLE